ncbi:MAG: OmpH family outer membrane protein [Cyclobacteriaceae bacterium]|nr:OmpH family outer membrane protein [Cyclobacteriaceae bacterium]
MKYFSIVLNLVLLAAVIILFVLHFSGNKPSSADPEILASDTTMPEKISIVYINEDSLLENYVYFKELAASLESKRKNLETDYTSKAQGLQTEIANFQQNAGNMTMSQARAVEEDLVRKQQNLMRYQETLAQDMMKEESDVNLKLFQKVSEYVEGYAMDNGYTVVLNYKPGSVLLYGHQAMDVTEEVVDGLNAAYEESKNTATAKKPAEKAKTDTTAVK